MTEKNRRALIGLREEFRDKVDGWIRGNPGLREAQERIRKAKGYEDYAIETPIVYNTALDALNPDSTVKYILVADNPGKREQLRSNRSYLVGQSGKLAASFFREALGTDFRKEVLILNKTPVHTPKTGELKLLLEFAALIGESQRYMADLVFRFHSLFRCPLWIVGYSELGGLFAPFAESLFAAYRGTDPGLASSVLVFRHFSMNQFSIDLKRSSIPGLGTDGNLARIGSAYRKKYLGF